MFILLGFYSNRIAVALREFPVRSYLGVQDTWVGGVDRTQSFRQRRHIHVPIHVPIHILLHIYTCKHILNPFPLTKPSPNSNAPPPGPDPTFFLLKTSFKGASTYYN